ncbi:MAG: acyltransferase [Flavobacterium sp.]|uniref:acyltransferase family protein n=1 Tax=Flavobacterium sp. TaxID=239 RepID=UPI0012082FA6|nr:acyltransferase [Flavobacterium sp.]RZJ66059.1 MAG: acyltransferase [Flavobacterium sp.]
MKLSFKRITSSGSFIPEIDGLRFIAVVSVVLYHYWCFFNIKDASHYKDSIDYSFLEKILSHGNFGVPLFFAISGLILGMPFAKYHIENGKKVSLKQYFLRRLTRLEPPYIIVMTLLAIGAVYVAKTLTFDEALPRYLSSLVYINNFIYPGLQANGVAWSLEIEVQFYILAPILALVFAIGNANVRRILLSIAIVLMIGFNYVSDLPFISLLNYLQYFLLGFLLADLYVSKQTLLPKTGYDSVIALLCFCVIWLFERGDFAFAYQNYLWEVLQIACVFLLYYYILFHKVFSVMRMSLVTNIGGMCYSIYLLHYYVMSAFGNPLMRFQFSGYSFVNITIYTLIMLVPIAVSSALFFLLVERPCMDKNWYKKIFGKKETTAVAN